VTTYRVRGKYDVFVKTTEDISVFCQQMQEKAYNEGAVSGFFDVTQDEQKQIVVIFKRDLEEDRDYAMERCPSDLRSGLMKQLHAELLEGGMPPVSLEWVADDQKAYRVVEKKLRWCISTYEPVRADTKEEAQEAVETGCVDDAYQGSDQSQSQETVYEITEIDDPIPEGRKPHCPVCFGDQIIHGLPEWKARSLEPQDSKNTAVIEEYRCETCGMSFWLPVEPPTTKEKSDGDASGLGQPGAGPEEAAGSEEVPGRAGVEGGAG
jgi:hypothetical protein